MSLHCLTGPLLTSLFSILGDRQADDFFPQNSKNSKFNFEYWCHSSALLLFLPWSFHIFKVVLFIAKDQVSPMSKFSSFDSITDSMTSYWRPVLILVCAMLLFNLPTLVFKVGMFLRGLVYLVMCNDKSWKKTEDPNIVIGPLLKSGEKLERKTVYFVRHGESTWNDTFNKGSHRSAIVFAIGFVPGLVKAVLYELYLILSGKLDRSVNDTSISLPTGK